MVKKLLFILFFGFLSFHFVQGQSFNNDVYGDKKDNKLLIAYPNPAKDILFIKVKDNAVKIKSIALYSILGVQISEFQVEASQTEIRLDRLKSGKYLLRYTLNDNTQKVTQFIKQ